MLSKHMIAQRYEAVLRPVRWEITVNGEVVSLRHEDAGYTMKFIADECDALVDQIRARVHEFDADKYASELWDEYEGNVPIEICADIAERTEAILHDLLKAVEQMEDK